MKNYRIPKYKAQSATATVGASFSLPGPNAVPIKPKTCPLISKDTQHSSLDSLDSTKSHRNTIAPAFNSKNSKNTLDASPGASFAIPGTSGLNTLKDKGTPAMDIPDLSKAQLSTSNVANKRLEVSKISDRSKFQLNKTKPAFDLKNLDNTLDASPGALFAVPGTSGLSTLKDKCTPAMTLQNSSKAVPNISKEDSKPSTTKTVTPSVPSKKLEASKTYRIPKYKAHTTTATLDAPCSLPEPSNIVPSKSKTTPPILKDVRRPSLDSSDIPKSVQSTTPAWAVPKYFEYILDASPGASFALPGTSGMGTLKDKKAPVGDKPSKIVPSTSSEESKSFTAKTVTSNVSSKELEESPRKTKKHAFKLKKIEHSSGATIQTSFVDPSKSSTSKVAALKSDRSPSKDAHCKTDTSIGSSSSSRTLGANQLQASKTSRSQKKKSRRRLSVQVDTSIALPGPSSIHNKKETTTLDHVKFPRNTAKPESDLKGLENISSVKLQDRPTMDRAGPSSRLHDKPAMDCPGPSSRLHDKPAMDCPGPSSRLHDKPAMDCPGPSSRLHDNPAIDRPGPSSRLHDKPAIDRPGPSSSLPDTPAINPAGISNASQSSSKYDSKNTSTKTDTSKREGSLLNTPGTNESEASNSGRSRKKKSRRRRRRSTTVRDIP